MVLQLFLARVCIPSGSHGAITFIQTAVHAPDWFLAKQLLEAQYGAVWVMWTASDWPRAASQE